jgi:DNA-binding CsgD family transcriptional regulator
MGLGQSWKFPGVEINALWGHDADLREAVERLEGTAGKGLLGASTAARDLSLTVHALSRGHYADAYRLARTVNDEDAPVFGNQILPELVEAATRFGKMRIAEQALRTLTERAQTSGTDWARGLLARSQGLLASNGHAEAHYVDAIASLDKARMPLDHARAHLLYGEWLRRRRRRSDAVEQLTRAHGMFVEMGTEAFADRAAIELRAAGAAAHSRVVARKHALTPQEEQVAQLAAHSMTNREIATALFISESTVAHHLKKVFQKLGLRSRRELKQRRFGTD